MVLGRSGQLRGQLLDVLIQKIWDLGQGASVLGKGFVIEGKDDEHGCDPRLRTKLAIGSLFSVLCGFVDGAATRPKSPSHELSKPQIQALRTKVNVQVRLVADSWP